MSRQQQRGFDLGDYIDVPARIAEFRSKHPEGSLQPADPSQPFRVLTIGDQTYVVVVAAAYRTPEDPRPGIGMAYEQWPGRTPYTKDSELQNAETSAWGRAIVAALAADTKRGIASAEDVRNRQAERQPLDPEQVRRNILDRATAAIRDAKLREECDKIGHRIAEHEKQQRITEQDAIELRRLLVAKLDELFPQAQEPPQAEQTPEEQK